MVKVLKDFFKKYKLIFFLTIISLVIRIYFRMVWLEDWDSVQFALALHHFDIGENLPHAPGYPLYILLGKVIYFFVKNDTLSLIFLSIICGLVSILIFYLICLSIFEKKIAFLGAVLFSIVPIHMVMSITALTNIVGLASFLLFVYLLIKYGKRKILYISFLGGLILGIRATEALSIVTIFFFFLVFNRESFKRMLQSLFAFVMGVITWIIPLFFISGFSSFFSSYGWISSYVISHDSFLGQQDRISRILYLLNVSYGWPLLALSVIGLFLLIRNKVKLNKFFKYLIIIWFFSYLIPLGFIFNLEVPRYTLPLLPPLVALFLIFAVWITKKIGPTFSFCVFGIIILATFLRGYSQLSRLKKSVPPTIAVVEYLLKNYSPNDVLMLTSFTYRQFQYYAPEFKAKYDQLVTVDDLKGKKYVILDLLNLKDQLPIGYKTKLVDQKEFVGDRDIYSRISKVNLYIFKTE